MRESQIEDILMDNPYLIRSNYTAVRRQLVFQDRTRADIIFYGTPILVIEIKRGLLVPSDVEQVCHYLDNIELSSKEEKRGILVGLDYDENLASFAREKKYAIAFLRLGVDVPTSLQLCGRCRKYCSTRFERCPYCNSKELRYMDSTGGK